MGLPSSLIVPTAHLVWQLLGVPLAQRHPIWYYRRCAGALLAEARSTLILSVTPNVALDRTLVVPEFHPGRVYRPTATRVAPGGKGINLTRVILKLGGDSVCAGFLAGHTGRLLAELAEREGLPAAWTWVAGETRTCVIVADPQTGESTVINEYGLVTDASMWQQLERDVLDQAAKADCVCFCGSLPPGSPLAAFTSTLEAVTAAGKPVWVDTSGDPLRAALQAGGVNIKVNGEEAGEVLGWAVSDAQAALVAADALHQRGAAAVVLTLGAAGAVLSAGGERWRARPPEVKVLNAVASGDSFLAGLTMSLAQGFPMGEALRRGVAAGTANALAGGGGHFGPETFNQVLPQVHLERA